MLWKELKDVTVRKDTGESYQHEEEIETGEIEIEIMIEEEMKETEIEIEMNPGDLPVGNHRLLVCMMADAHPLVLLLELLQEEV
jgi:hypothetical protein